MLQSGMKVAEAPTGPLKTPISAQMPPDQSLVTSDSGFISARVSVIRGPSVVSSQGYPTPAHFDAMMEKSRQILSPRVSGSW
jgi:hypothetical protein